MKKIIGLFLAVGISLYAGECCKGFNDKEGALKLKEYYEAKKIEMNGKPLSNMSKCTVDGTLKGISAGLKINLASITEEGTLLNGAYVSNEESMPILISSGDKRYIAEAMAAEKGPRALVRLSQECDLKGCKPVDGFIIDQSDLLVGVNGNSMHCNACLMNKFKDMKDRINGSMCKTSTENIKGCKKGKSCDSAGESCKTKCKGMKNKVLLVEPGTKVYIYKF